MSSGEGSTPGKRDIVPSSSFYHLKRGSVLQVSMRAKYHKCLRCSQEQRNIVEPTAKEKKMKSKDARDDSMEITAQLQAIHRNDVTPAQDPMNAIESQPTIGLDGAISTEYSSIEIIASFSTTTLESVAPAEPKPLTPPSPTQPPSSPKSSTAKVRIRTRRIIITCVIFLAGMLVGMLALFLFALTYAKEGQVLPNPLPSPGADIVLQLGPAYLSRIVGKALQDSGLPGAVKNVRVSLVNGDQITITGDDHVVIDLPFTIVVQPLIRSCQVQIHLLRADAGAIPVTSFADTFTGQINQQLQINLNNLTPGFTYCATGVRTAPDGLFVTYAATPS